MLPFPERRELLICSNGFVIDLYRHNVRLVLLFPFSDLVGIQG